MRNPDNPPKRVYDKQPSTHQLVKESNEMLQKLTGDECSHCLGNCERNKAKQCQGCGGSEREPVMIDANLLLDYLKEREEQIQQHLNSQISPHNKTVVRSIAKIAELRTIAEEIKDHIENYEP